MKRIVASFLVAVLMLTTLICCPLNVSAVGEKITLLSEKGGVLENHETISFKFRVPALSKVTIAFIGYNTVDWDFGTYGNVKIKIKDSNGNIVFNKTAIIEYDDTNYSISLEKGDYRLYLTENSQLDDDYFDNQFEYCFKISGQVIEIVPPENISLNTANAELHIGDTLKLTETVKPSYASGVKSWTSSNPKVATVNSAGKVTAVSVGTTKITCKVGDKTATCAVTVTHVQPTSLLLSEKEVELLKGNDLDIAAIYLPSNVSVKPVWSSSAPKVATVNSSGRVTAKASGNATITCKLGNKTASCKVIVKEISVSLNKTKATLQIGKTLTLTKKVSPSYVEGTASWSSSNPKVATVSKTGKVTAVALGTSKITCKFADKTAICTVTVTHVQPTSLSEQNGSKIIGGKNYYN